MDFKKYQRHYDYFKNQLDKNLITREQFEYEISRLNFKTPDGTKWKLDFDGSWLVWDVNEWINSNPNNYQNVTYSYTYEKQTGNLESATVYAVNSLQLKTLWELIALFIVRFVKYFICGLKKRICISAVIALAILILHTYFLVHFTKDLNINKPSQFLINSLVVKDKLISGTLFWIFLCGLIWKCIVKIKNIKLFDFFIQLRDTILDFLKTLIITFYKLGTYNLALLLWGIISGFIFSLIFKNSLLCLILSFYLLLCTSEKQKSLIILNFKLLLSDFNKLFKIKEGTSIENALIFTYGIIFGLICTYILTLTPATRILEYSLLILLVVFIIINNIKKQKSAVLSIIFITLFAMWFFTPLTTYAYDKVIILKESIGIVKGLLCSILPSVAAGFIPATSYALDKIRNDIYMF